MKKMNLNAQIIEIFKISKFPIGVETTIDKLHFINSTQIQKILFLWLKFMSRKNSKN